MIKAIIKAPLVGYVFDKKKETKQNATSTKTLKQTGLLELRVNFLSARFYISTGNRILPSEWDAKKKQVNTKCLKHNVYNTMYATVNNPYQYAKPIVIGVQLTNVIVDLSKWLKKYLLNSLFVVLVYPLLYPYLYFLLKTVRSEAKKTVTVTANNYVSLRTYFDALNGVLNTDGARFILRLDVSKQGILLRPLLHKVKAIYQNCNTIRQNIDTALDGLNLKQKPRFMIPISESELWQNKHPKYDYLAIKKQIANV